MSEDIVTHAAAMLPADMQTVLIIINLIFTFVTTTLAAIKFKAKCGNNFFSCKPKDAASSPSSDPSNFTPRYGGGGSRQAAITELPSDAIAVIVDDSRP